MVQPEYFNNHPETNIGSLPNGTAGSFYEEQLTSLCGHGKLKWELVEGTFPEGLNIKTNGKISGIPKMTDSYSFTIKTTDEKEQTDQTEIVLKIN